MCFVCVSNVFFCSANITKVLNMSLYYYILILLLADVRTFFDLSPTSAFNVLLQMVVGNLWVAISFILGRK